MTPLLCTFLVLSCLFSSYKAHHQSLPSYEDSSDVFSDFDCAEEFLYDFPLPDGCDHCDEGNANGQSSNQAVWSPTYQISPNNLAQETLCSNHHEQSISHGLSNGLVECENTLAKTDASKKRSRSQLQRKSIDQGAVDAHPRFSLLRKLVSRGISADSFREDALARMTDSVADQDRTNNQENSSSPLPNDTNADARNEAFTVTGLVSTATPLPRDLNAARKLIRQRIKSMLRQQTGHSTHHLDWFLRINWPEGVSINGYRWTRKDMTEIWSVIDTVKFVLSNSADANPRFKIVNSKKKQVHDAILRQFQDDAQEPYVTFINWTLAYFTQIPSKYEISFLNSYSVLLPEIFRNSEIVKNIRFVPACVKMNEEVALQNTLLRRYRCTMRDAFAHKIPWGLVYVAGYPQDFTFRSLSLTEIRYFANIASDFVFAQC